MAIQLSVVVITFNEEKNIAKCLDAVSNLTDDIVVVDSFSTDKTKEICSSYSNVNFIESKWEGYAKTKNYANQQAKYDYILSLDADEVISPTLKKSIQGISEQSGIFEFNRLTNYCGKWIKHCGWYPDKKIRIFPKKEVYWEGDYVHETLFIPKSMSVSFLKGDLLHYSFYSTEQHLSQIEKYTTLNAEKMLAKGKKVSFLKQYFSPLVKFLKSYIFQLGFLDGYYGYVVCKNSAYAKRLKYVKLKALLQKT